MTRIATFIFFLAFLSLSNDLFAQAPDSINYQAVARDDQGKVLSNEDLDVRMSVFAGSSGGTLVYEEEHLGVSTNQFGLFNLYIGGGDQTGGSAASFDAIDWGNNEHHIEVEIDAGSGYESLGSRKFVSVPYALYAENAGTGGGGGSLQSAYEGGNTITLDSNGTPVRIDGANKTRFYTDTSAVRIGHTNPLPNVNLDVRYGNDPTPGPAILGASAPTILPNFVFQGDAFQQNNSGVFGVGIGTRKAIGVTGFSVHNANTPAAQDSIYGVTGIAVDRKGKTSVGVSAIARAFSNDVQRSVGIYSIVDDQISTDYQNNPTLAGGVFDANIDPGHTSLDSTFGVIGLSGYGGEHAIGVLGRARGDTGLTQNTYGVIAEGGVSTDTNIGILATGNTFPSYGKSIAAWFREGKTVLQDTLQVDYGNPVAGEVLMAVDKQGNAVWDSVPSTGTPIMLQDAYDNGDSIGLSSGGKLELTDNGGGTQYLYAEDGSAPLSVGHQQPIGGIGGNPVSLHVANGGPNPGQVLISAGDNSNSYDAVLAFSENVGSTYGGAEIRWDAGYNKLILGRDVGGGAPMLAVQGGPGTTHGVLIGGSYSQYSSPAPPENGLLVEDTVGIATGNPAHKHHIEGRTYSSNGMLVDDTANYRYNAPKRHHEGFIGAEMRPSGDASTNRNYVVTTAGRSYFTNTISTSGIASASLDLPNGAVVDSVVYHVYDTSSTKQLNLSLQRVSYGGSPSYNTVSGASATSTGSGAETLYGIPTNPLVIDNENYMYQIVAEFPAGGGTEVQLANIRISYTVRKAE